MDRPEGDKRLEITPPSSKEHRGGSGDLIFGGSLGRHKRKSANVRGACRAGIKKGTNYSQGKRLPNLSHPSVEKSLPIGGDPRVVTNIRQGKGKSENFKEKVGKAHKKGSAPILLTDGIWGGKGPYNGLENNRSAQTWE